MSDITESILLTAGVIFTVWLFASHQSPILCYISLATDILGGLLLLRRLVRT